MRLKKCLKRIRSLLIYTLRDYNMNRMHLIARSSNSDEKKFATLRMLCHMLDKGVNNVNFEKGHSKAIWIKATTILKELSELYNGDPSFLWCQKVIASYENAQQNGRVVGISVPKSYNEEDRLFIEYFIRSRISCRNFTGKKIEQNVLDKIVDIAIDAPNGCCRQTTRFYITQDERKIAQIIPCVAGITNFSKISCLVAVTAEISFYELIDKNLQYLDSALAAENFILAARMFNIFGTMCNIFHASLKELECLKNNYGIPNTENITMIIAIGYPSEIPEKPIRRNLSSFVRYV